MADTKTAAQRRHPVPHQHFSGAKIRIIPETSKQFPKFNIKQREASIKSRLSYVLSYGKNYINYLHL
jgi:hypothetical protein